MSRRPSIEISTRRLSCFAQSPTEEETTLTPEQLEVLELWHLCGVNVDVKTFWHIWRLTEFGISPQDIASFLNDISKYDIGKTLKSILNRQQTI